MLRNLFRKKSDRIAEELQNEAGEAKSSAMILEDPEQESRQGWLQRLSKGLGRTRGGWVGAIGSLFSSGITEDALDEFEELLIQGDLGVEISMKLVEFLREKVAAGEIKTADDVRQQLKQEISRNLTMDPTPLKLTEKPFSVILMVGINGVGKTTTTAKLGHLFKQMGRKCLFVAADTFRAGAVEQLETWAGRLEIPVVTGKPNQDPASVAFDGMEKAREAGVDIVLVDTAGRLHTQKGLMDEVKKISRVIHKNFPGAPHEILMVVDATTGQNAINQASQFHEILKLTGIVVTKLDGSAKGGALLQVHQKLGVPVRFIGVGEQFNDLQSFDALEFAEALFEL